MVIPHVPHVPSPPPSPRARRLARALEDTIEHHCRDDRGTTPQDVAQALSMVRARQAVGAPPALAAAVAGLLAVALVGVGATVLVGRGTGGSTTWLLLATGGVAVTVGLVAAFLHLRRS